MSPTNSCPDPEQLRDLLQGEGDAELASEFEQHLEQCERCSRTLRLLGGENTLAGMVRAHAQGALPAEEIAAVSTLIRQLANQAQLATAKISTSSTDRVLDVTFLAPAEEPDEIGSLGPYRVRQVLGKGGMGMVFLAEDPQLKRQVALKVMLPALAAKKADRERFRREAQSMAALEHDHIVAVFQVGEDRGIPYLAMPLLKGGTLEERLRRESPLPISEAVRIGREMALGLAAAHERGLIHRDVKPANVWLEENTGRVKILDFGLARAWSDASQITQSGMIMGTPTYMAPEQSTGSVVDERADLFSLGVVLYEMLTGMSPFSRGNMMAILHAVAFESPKPPLEVCSQIPAELSALVMRLLEKKPERRPAGREVLDELHLLGSPDPMPAPNPQKIFRGTPWGWIIGLATIATILIAATIIVIDQGKYGTVTIDVGDDEKIRVVVKQNGQEVQVADAANGWTIGIREGKYELEMQGSPDDIKLARDSIEVTRGNTTRAKIVRTPQAAGELSDPMPNNPVANPMPSPIARREPYKLRGETTAELSPAALVSHPAKLAGVASWTFESRNHRSNVQAAGANPQRTLMAAADDDGIVRIWDMQVGRLKAVLLPRTLTRSAALAWSSEGKYLATRLCNDQIDIWEEGTGRRVRELGKAITPQNFKRGGLAWSPRRDLLAFAGWGLSIHDFAANETKVVVPEQCEGIAWSPDGAEAAIAFTTGEIRVYETMGWKVQRTIGEEEHLDNITWSPRGDLLATHHSPWGGPPPGVRLWKARESDDPLPELKWEKNRPSGNNLLEWSPAGDELWCAVDSDSAGFLTSFSLEGGKVRNQYFPMSQMGAMAASHISQTKELFLLATNGVVTRYKLEVVSEPEVLFDAEYSRRDWDGGRPSPDGQLLLRYSHPHGRGWLVSDAVLYDTRTTQVLALRKESPWVGPPVWTAASDLVAVADSTDGIQVYDRKLAPRGKLGTEPALALKPRTWSANGQRLYATAGEKAFVWDWPKFRPSQSWTAESGEVKALAVSGDGKRIATAGAKDIHIWRADKVDAPERTFPIGEMRPDQGIMTLLWCPDHHRLLVGTWHAGAVLIDVDSETMQNLDSAEHIVEMGWDVRHNVAMSISSRGLIQNWDLASLEARGTSTLGDTSLDRLYQNYVSLVEGGATAFEANRAYETKTGLPYATFLYFNGARMVRFSPEGDFAGPAGIEKELVAIVKTDGGEYQTLSVEEFAKVYGWKNPTANAGSPASSAPFPAVAE